MVFTRIAGGFVCGVGISFFAHENVYLTIATCFLRPHLKFRMDNAKRSKDLAIPAESLDSYLLDVGKSFALFWILIGPVLYKTYYKKEDLFEKDEHMENEIHQVEDRTVTLLKRLKEKASTEVTAEKQDNSGDKMDKT